MNNTPNQKRITILHTTDVHCQVHPHDEMFWENGQPVFRKAGGYAHLSTYFKEARENSDATFLVDTGDMFQGSQLSVETEGRAMLPILNALGYNLFIPGNWEVVYGKEAMISLMGGLNARKICTNMFHDAGDGNAGELIFPACNIWTVDCLKIGFLAYTDPLVPKRQPPAYSKGIVYTPPEENLAHYVRLLKEEEHCDFIILLSHLGLSQQIALANNPACKGVDYIFGGDTHERVRKPIECTYAKVVEPGAFGSFVGRLELLVEDGKIAEVNYRLDEVNPQRFGADEAVAAIIEEQEQPFKQEIDRIVGYSTLPLYRYFVVENTIDTLIVDALMWKVQPDIVLSNGFRFCPPNSSPDATGNIPITRGFIYDMLPVDSLVRTGKVTGQQLRKWLEKELNNVFAREAAKRFGGWLVKFKGMQIKFESFGEAGERVKEITVGGKALEDDTLYSISACEREGDPADVLCRMQNVEDTENTAYTLHEVLLEYLALHSPVTPTPPGNAIILDASQQILTQVQGVDYEFV